MCPSVLVYVTVSVSVTKSRPSWCEFTTAIWCVMRKRTSPCWLQLCTVGSYHPRQLRDAHSSRRILRVRRAPRQSLRSVPTNILHNTVMVCLQQLALLAQTLRPTRWQQLVSTARRRRRNVRRVALAVARRCERQRRGSQHAGIAMCRTHLCAKSRRANVCIQSHRVFFEGIGATVWSTALTPRLST